MEEQDRISYRLASKLGTLAGLLEAIGYKFLEERKKWIDTFTPSKGDMELNDVIDFEHKMLARQILYRRICKGFKLGGYRLYCENDTLYYFYSTMAIKSGQVVNINNLIKEDGYAN